MSTQLGFHKFAPARVATEGNVRFKIRDGAVGTIEGLLLNRLEGELHRLLKPPTCTGASRLDNPFAKTVIGLQKSANRLQPRHR